jgi:hypothetical protein
MNEDWRRLLQPAVSRVDWASLAKIVTSIRGLRLLLADTAGAVDDLASIHFNGATYFDTTHVPDSDALTSLMNQATVDRVVYGSGAPVFDVKASLNVLEQANLHANADSAIRSGNAKRLVAG